MALYKVIDSAALDTGMTAVADAIRAKAGLTDPLVWPDGFKSAVDSIQSGGGATEPYIEETYDANGNLINANLVGHTIIRPYAFYNCKSLALTSLPSGLTSIGQYAFEGCSNLALTSLPSSVTSIGNYAFQACLRLTSITFQGKPNSIRSDAFSICNNLETINVPWASGEVAGAPWGATNATINYNYTG